MWERAWSQGKEMSQGNCQIKGSRAHSRNVDRARGSEKTFPCFLDCKGDRPRKEVLSDLQDTANEALQ